MQPYEDFLSTVFNGFDVHSEFKIKVFKYWSKYHSDFYFYSHSTIDPSINCGIDGYKRPPIKGDSILFPSNMTNFDKNMINEPDLFHDTYTEVIRYYEDRPIAMNGKPSRYKECEDQARLKSSIKNELHIPILEMKEKQFWKDTFRNSMDELKFFWRDQHHYLENNNL